MQITLQQAWTIILPTLAILISYGLQQEHWKPEINAAIALVSVAAASTASLLIQGDSFTTASIVAALALAPQSEALAPLMQYLRAYWPVPLVPPTQQPQPPPLTARATATDWSRTPSSTPPPPPIAGQ